MTALPSIKIRAKVNFPATVQGNGGIVVNKQNGVWTVEPDFSELTDLETVADPASKQIWVYDPTEDTYSVLTLLGLGNSLYRATSTTSLAIGQGSKTFVTQANKDIPVGSWVLAVSDADESNYMLGQVTAYSNTSLTISVPAAGVGGSGTLADWTLILSGAPGVASPPGLRQTFDDGTTDADPGAGKFRFDNSTVASATACYLDNLDLLGNTVSGIIDRWDNSTNTTKGTLRFDKVGDPTVWAEFAVTGSVVDGTGYRKLTLTGGAANGTFEGDFAITFTRSGDVGAQGEPGTLGGVTGSTDNAILKADGTGGSTVQGGTTTEDDSGKVTINFSDSGTTTVPSALKLSRATSGTAANGIGVRQEFEIENGSGTQKVAAAIDVISTDVTNGSEDFDFVVKLMAGGAAVAEVVRFLSTGVAYLAGSATKIILHAAGGQTLTGGFAATPYSAGTKSSGTFTPDSANGNFQYATNGGAHTLAPPANPCSLCIEYTNNGSAGAVTTSSFTKVSGGTITTTNGNKFLFFVTKHQTYSHLHVQVLQ